MSRAESGVKGRVLYIGQAYYNAFYLSRALRRRGWAADVLSFSSEGADPYSHGYDIRLDYADWDYSRNRVGVWLFGAALALYARTLERQGPVRVAGLWEQRLLKWLMTSYMKHLASGARKTRQRPAIEALRAAVHHYDIFHFTSEDNLRYFFFFNPRYLAGDAVETDMLLLKRLGKKIVYTNAGCNDGVLQSTFMQWDEVPVCTVCPWRTVPSICSDERNHKWGTFRNRVADYQCTSMGNRADFNLDPNVHEVPEFFCLDPGHWRPDLMVPANYRLPYSAQTVKIYHAVGNFEIRTASGSNQNIKSTHIYLPTIARLKAEGYDVEMIFFSDVPNRQLRFYQAQADIVVDMLTVGFFGANVREALMMGIPAVCYLRPAWLETIRLEIPDFVDDLPVVSATPETVYDVLRDLIEHPDKRREIGRRSREFALKWFSDEAGGRRLGDIYAQLLRGEEIAGWRVPRVRTEADTPGTVSSAR